MNEKMGAKMEREREHGMNEKMETKWKMNERMERKCGNGEREKMKKWRDRENEEMERE